YATKKHLPPSPSEWSGHAKPRAFDGQPAGLLVAGRHLAGGDQFVDDPAPSSASRTFRFTNSGLSVDHAQTWTRQAWRGAGPPATVPPAPTVPRVSIARSALSL